MKNTLLTRHQITILWTLIQNQTIPCPLSDYCQSWVSDLWYSEDEFERAQRQYESTLSESGFNISQQYIQTETKIFWFDPPFSQNVKTNIRKMFFKLINLFQDHIDFPNKQHQHSHQLSYSTTTNMEIWIKHNKNTRLGNCRNKESCPLNGKFKHVLFTKQIVASNPDI